MVLYHGSERVIKRPFYGGGHYHNDYGQGFYCTENPEMAKEWACRGSKTAFINKYELDVSSLKVLNLSDPSFSILNWLAILLENRIFDLKSPVAISGKEVLLKEYLPAYKDYDVIIGYRADDSYFSFANDFINNSLPIGKLSRAMRLGNLGEQVVIKSPKAFDNLRFLGSEPVDTTLYGLKRQTRDDEARQSYKQITTEGMKPGDQFLLDILRIKTKKYD